MAKQLCHRKDSLFIASISLLTLLLLDRAQIFLEPIVLAFLLLSSYLLIKWKHNRRKMLLLLSGAVLFLAFFTKQYAILALPASCIYLVLESENWGKIIKNIFLFTFGFTIFLLLTLIYYHVRQDVDIIEMFVSRMLGIQYITKSTVVTGTNYSAGTLVNSIYNIFFNKFPYLSIIFALPFVYSNKMHKNEIIYFFLLSAFLSFQLIFASYQHYFILILPFAIIFIILAIQGNDMKSKIIQYIFYFLTFQFLVFSLTMAGNHYLNYKREYPLQVDITKQITRYIPSKSKVFLQSYSPCYYFLCNYNSANCKSIGYSFPSLEPINNFIDRADKGSFIIVSTDAYLHVKLRDDILFIDNLNIDNQPESVILKKVN